MRSHLARSTLVAIVAGEEDRIVDIDEQSARLHRQLSQSTLHRVAGVGPMVHQSATDVVMAAIEEATAHITKCSAAQPSGVG